MLNEMTTRAWQQAFAAGEFDSPDIQTQISAGWCDWWCKNASLANKTRKMGNIIRKIQDGGKVDLDRTYVWFKNCCPLAGPLYDTFRFADIETGDVLMTVCIGDKRRPSRYEVYTRSHGFKEPAFGCDDSRQLVKWLNEAE